MTPSSSSMNYAPFLSFCSQLQYALRLAIKIFPGSAQMVSPPWNTIRSMPETCIRYGTYGEEPGSQEPGAHLTDQWLGKKPPQYYTANWNKRHCALKTNCLVYELCLTGKVAQVNLFFPEPITCYFCMCQGTAHILALVRDSCLIDPKFLTERVYVLSITVFHTFKVCLGFNGT